MLSMVLINVSHIGRYDALADDTHGKVATLGYVHATL